MITDDLVRRFASLYSGYSKAYGQTDLKNARRDDRGKIKGRSYTIQKPISLGHYRAHLEGQGTVGLGVFLLRDDDETVFFGSIDVDDYKSNPVGIERAIRSLSLPLVIVRSKSGGAHLVCFAKEPVLATIMQQKLTEWTALLGYSDKTEIFPKQCTRATEEDVGSWLNLPYFGGSEERYAVLDGKPLGLEEFLDHAEKMRVTVGDLDSVRYEAGDERDLFYEGPPCLQHLHTQGGFVEGTKRDGMFNVAIYLRRRFPDDWSDRLHTYNTAMCDPPLRNDEIQDLIKSVKKKEYSYKCKQPPIASCCQRRLCFSRRFGVGDIGPQSGGLEISAVTRYQVEGTSDPPIWGLEIAGRRILVDNATLYSRDDFNRACLAAISRVPIHVPPARWLRIVDELAASAEVQYTPQEVSETGNVLEWIKAYLAGAKCTAIDQVASGGVFIEEGFAFFRVLDLFSFLDARRVAYKNKRMVYHLLRDLKGETSYMNFKKGGFSVWKVPVPKEVVQEQEADFKQQTPF